MPQLNANIPYQEAYVRNSFLFSDWENKELTKCYIFGCKAVLNKPLMFHCQLDNGVVWFSLPIHAFVHKENYEKPCENEKELLSLLQYWNMQSSDIAVTTFSYLKDYTIEAFNRRKKWMKGKYLFTIDDYYSDNNSLPLGYSDDPDKKCFHFLKLDNGFFAVYPNNYLRFHNLNFCDVYKMPPKYKRNSWEWDAEYIKLENDDDTIKSAD